MGALNIKCQIDTKQKTIIIIAEEMGEHLTVADLCTVAEEMAKSKLYNYRIIDIQIEQKKSKMIIKENGLFKGVQINEE